MDLLMPMLLRRHTPAQTCIMRDSITKGEWQMLKRLFCGLSAIALAAVLGLPAQAGEAGGSIRLDLDVGDFAVTNGAVKLYQVALQGPEGYLLSDSFGGGMVKPEDALSSSLAQWLAQTAEDGGITRLLDADGCAEFSRLPDGLYLVVQSEKMDGFYPFEPFLVSIPMEGEWDIQVSPPIFPIVAESPATGQDMQPFLGIAGMVVSGLGLALCIAGKRRFIL